MAAAYFINLLFLLLTGNRIQDCHTTCYFALGQDDFYIVIVFLRRDERKKFGLVVVLILVNDL